jgi:thiol-disulfide isomerase/thioredoxin
MMRRTAIAGALSLWVPAVCYAGTLTIGDNAPPLNIAHWIKGEPVEAFESGKVYVVEFWATWCPPCRLSMPHITELQKQFADYDVTFIGVSDEKLPVVVNFLCKADKEDVLWNAKIGYTLAADPDRSTHDAYMKPAHQRGIPTAFIVGKDGRIEWIGHPMNMDGVLEKVVHDTWDRAAFKTTFEEDLAAEQKLMEVRAKIFEAAENDDWDQAIALANELEGANSAYGSLKGSLFVQMLTNSDDYGRAYKFGRAVMKDFWDNAGLLNMMAWSTVDDEGVKERDLDFAMKAAQRANELTDEKNAAILDTLARVYFEKGDLKTAIKWQRKAVKNAGESPMAEDLEATLKKYEDLAESRL